MERRVQQSDKKAVKIKKKQLGLKWRLRLNVDRKKLKITFGETKNQTSSKGSTKEREVGKRSDEACDEHQRTDITRIKTEKWMRWKKEEENLEKVVGKCKRTLLLKHDGEHWEIEESQGRKARGAQKRGGNDGEEEVHSRKERRQARDDGRWGGRKKGGGERLGQMGGEERERGRGGAGAKRRVDTARR